MHRFPRAITIDAPEAFFRNIVNRKQVNMTKEATENTLTSLLGMAYETKREVAWRGIACVRAGFILNRWLHRTLGEK